MNPPKLGICLSDLRLEIKPALERARSLGFRAVDLSAVSGPISPGELTDTGKRHFGRHVTDLGLRLASLRGPSAGQGYHDPIEGERRLDTMRRVLALASDLRVPVVSTTLGPIGRQPALERTSLLKEALEVIADDADRLGVQVALETAGVTASALNQILMEINCPLLSACCDSGAMLMQGEDPHHVAEALAGRIVHVRARDAVAGAAGAVGHEVAMGEGQLNPAAFLASLTEAGFAGDMILTRSAGQNSAADLVHARKEFEKYLP